MAEGILLYPDKDYTFENVPQVLLGGTYIGSHCWPKAGTWTIEYQAPVKLYVWATQGKYSGGVEDVLPADGWAVEAADGFCGGAMALKLWSRHFTTGSSLQHQSFLRHHGRRCGWQTAGVQRQSHRLFRSGCRLESSKRNGRGHPDLHRQRLHFSKCACMSNKWHLHWQPLLAKSRDMDHRVWSSHHAVCVGPAGYIQCWSGWGSQGGCEWKATYPLNF